MLAFLVFVMNPIENKSKKTYAFMFPLGWAVQGMSLAVLAFMLESVLIVMALGG